MKFFRAIFPYGGTFGDDTVFPTRGDPNQDAKLHVHFVADDWPEEVFETAGYYAVSDEIRKEFELIGVTGIRYEKCAVSLSWQFFELNPNENRSLPCYFLMIIEGSPRIDDLGIEGRNVLIVSERVAQILKSYAIEDLDLLDLD